MTRRTSPGSASTPPIGGPAIEGKLRLSAITLKTDIGSTTITMEHIRRITFQKEPASKSKDTVQLTDKSIVRGRVTAEQFVVDRDGGAEVDAEEGRHPRDRVIQHDVPLSWTAILLGLLTLSAMEIILGIDNIIFLAIVVGPAAGGTTTARPQDRSWRGARHAHRCCCSRSRSSRPDRSDLHASALPFLHDLDAREVSLARHHPVRAAGCS